MLAVALLAVVAATAFYLREPRAEGSWYASYETKEGTAYVQFTITEEEGGRVRGTGGWRVGSLSYPFSLEGARTGKHLGMRIDFTNPRSTLEGSFVTRDRIVSTIYTPTNHVFVVFTRMK